jgi:hypothetical protein
MNNLINKDSFVVTLNAFTNPPYSSQIKLQNQPIGYNYYSVYSTIVVNLETNFSIVTENYIDGKLTLSKTISTSENDCVVYKHNNIAFNEKFIKIIDQDIPKLNEESVTLVFTFFMQEPQMLRQLPIQRIFTFNFVEDQIQKFYLNAYKFNYVQVFTNVDTEFKIDGLIKNYIRMDSVGVNTLISNNKLTFYDCLETVNMITITYDNYNKRKDIYFTLIFY